MERKTSKEMQKSEDGRYVRKCRLREGEEEDG